MSIGVARAGDVEEAMHVQHVLLVSGRVALLRTSVNRGVRHGLLWVCRLP